MENDSNVIQLRAARITKDANSLSDVIRARVEQIAEMQGGKSVEWIDEKSATILDALLEMREAADERLTLRFPAPIHDADLKANERAVSIWIEKVLERCGSALIKSMTQLLGP